METNRKQLEYIAELAQLRFTDQEYSQLEQSFKDYQQLFDEIRSAKVDITKIWQNPVGIADLRPDEPRPSLPIEKALKGARRKRGRYFVVPMVVE